MQTLAEVGSWTPDIALGHSSGLGITMAPGGSMTFKHQQWPLVSAQTTGLRTAF